MSSLDDEVRSLIDNTEVDGFTDFNLTSATAVVDSLHHQAAVTPMKPKLEIEESTSESFKEDFDFARTNLKDLIASGQESLYRAMLVAATSDSPRAFEVVATMLKAVADINKELVAVHKAKSETTQVSQPTTNVQNNTVFVGSTSDLAKVLKGKVGVTIDNEG